MCLATTATARTDDLNRFKSGFQMLFILDVWFFTNIYQEDQCQHGKVDGKRIVRDRTMDGRHRRFSYRQSATGRLRPIHSPFTHEIASCCFALDGYPDLVRSLGTVRLKVRVGQTATTSDVRVRRISLASNVRQRIVHPSVRCERDKVMKACTGRDHRRLTATVIKRLNVNTTLQLSLSSDGWWLRRRRPLHHRYPSYCYQRRGRRWTPPPATPSTGGRNSA